MLFFCCSSSEMSFQISSFMPTKYISFRFSSLKKKMQRDYLRNKVCFQLLSEAFIFLKIISRTFLIEDNSATRSLAKDSVLLTNGKPYHFYISSFYSPCNECFRDHLYIEEEHLKECG